MASDVDEWTNDIHQGDAFDVLAELPAESVHAVVCDPPYGLAFMGRDWDDFEPKEFQRFCEKWAAECKRVLKPGGHLLAFGGNRTEHRMKSGVEDAGFEIRDTGTWHYGNGFPKALDVGKALDNDAAEMWGGFKTALKPATEFVAVARKPLDEDTVAENVLEHGTGALNIDGCRIDGEERPQRTHDGGQVFSSGHRHDVQGREGPRAGVRRHRATGQMGRRGPCPLWPRRRGPLTHSRRRCTGRPGGVRRHRRR